VHDGKERFAGIIELNDIKQKLFEPGQSDKIPSRSIMKKTAGYLKEDQDMHAHRDGKIRYYAKLIPACIK